MTGLLLLALLLVLLFGGLGAFVAKAFFIAALVVLVMAVLGGVSLGRGTRA